MSNKQKAKPEKNTVVINDIAELLGHALALEIEATERYADLAELMEAHNNTDVSELFVKMAEIEKLHVEHIIEMTNKHNMTDLPKSEWKWVSPEGPETTNPEDLHYLMQPYHALQLALINEQRAYEYYSQVANNTQDSETRSLASELATEEEEHVALVKVWLKKYPKVDDDWDYDDDPPLVVD
jgi:rubrerythrin